MIRLIVTILLISTIAVKSQSQVLNSFSNDIRFANHLLNIKEYKEAEIYLKGLIPIHSTKRLGDSLQYLLGKSFYLRKELSSSVVHFNLIDQQNILLWTNAQFYIAFGNNYLKEYQKSIQVLEKIEINDDLLTELKMTSLAGSYLLSHNLMKYDSTEVYLNSKHLQLQRTNQRLNQYAHDLKAFKRKSPALAGIFSAIIPGSGKVYAGKTGEGISTFLQNILFGLMARESYRKDGLNSVRFAIFGTIFSTIYISNIWASTFSVKIYRHEYNESLHESIMLDLHIPLRTILK